MCTVPSISHKANDANTPSTPNKRSATLDAAILSPANASPLNTEMAMMLRYTTTLFSNMASRTNSESSILNSIWASLGFAPSPRRKRAAAKVRTPVLRVNCLVSSKIPEKRTSASSFSNCPGSNACSRISHINSLAEEAEGSMYVMLGCTSYSMVFL